jgi:hypothetical protein
MAVMQLKIVFKLGSLGTDGVVREICSLVQSAGLAPTDFVSEGGKERLSSDAKKWRARNGFALAGPGLELQFGSTAASGISILDVRSERPPVPWGQWVDAFAASATLVMAWLADADYDHWQNAEDLLEYEAEGRSYAHLPTRSNGLPAPLERTVVDISGNPGRWSLRDGYIEAVGAEMWLGDAFWRITGKSKKAVESAKWLKVSRPSASVVHVRTFDRCFTSADGKEGELQDRLRALLFPKTERE